MAYLGGLPGILAAGTTAGLGTAEQQRAREDALMRLGLNLAQQQAELNLKKEQLVEEKRRTDLQLGPAEVALPPELGGGKFSGPRWAMPSILQGAIGRSRELSVEELRRQATGLGLDVPTLPTETIQAPGEAGRPAEDVADIPTIRQPTAESRAILGQRVPASEASSIFATLRSTQEARRKTAEEATKQGKVAQARARIKAGEKWEDISSDFPSLTAKDAHGYELAAPEKPENPKDIFDPRTGEITRINPDGTWKTIKPGTPDEGRTLDIEYKRLRNEKALLDKSTANLIEALRTGKPVDFKQARLAQGQYTTTGQKLILAADALPADSPDKVAIIESGADSLKTAAEIGRLMKDRGKTPPAPGETEDQRKARLRRKIIGTP